MTKRHLTALALGLALSFGAWATEPPKETRTLETKKGPVAFAHTKHLAAGAVCDDCHHTGKQERCGSCHGKEAKEKTPRFFDAVHKKSLKHSCLACHDAKAKAGKKVPVACTACHAG